MNKGKESFRLCCLEWVCNFTKANIYDRIQFKSICKEIKKKEKECMMTTICNEFRNQI